MLKLNSPGGILQTVTVGSGPAFPLYDGTNLWVPNATSSISVVRPGSGAVLATLTGNGLSIARGGAFDGQRILVTSLDSNIVSLWKADDLTPIGISTSGTSQTASAATGPTSTSLRAAGQIVRF